MGLREISLGIESGDDRTLERINKGYTSADILEQCHKLEEAGIYYWMPFLNGVAGRAHSHDHAVNSAKIFSRCKPMLVGTGGLTLFPGTPLLEEAQKGEFDPLCKQLKIDTYLSLWYNNQGDPMNKNLDLFLTFMKIGAFTFGGGYAMIPLIQREVCDNKQWLNEDDILEVVAIAESTPGPLAINAATFVGSRRTGTLGAVCATLGVVLPSFLIISLVSFVLKAFQESRAVQYAFMGIRAGVLALILKAVYTMFMATKKHAVSYVIMAAALVLTAFLKIDAVFVIIGCAVFGLVWSLLFRKEDKL